MENHYAKLVACLLFLFLFSNTFYAQTFYSATSGSWTADSTWVGGVAPTKDDDIVIKSGHVVTISGGAYKHKAGIVVESGGELIMDTGTYDDGFTFDGTEFHVFGRLTLTFSPEKDLTIKGTSLFWAHDGSEILVSDDMKIEGKSTNIIDDVCIEVDDDFHIKGKDVTLCGSGGASIGTDTGSNTFNLQNGASMDQVCAETAIYRGAGGTCTTLVQRGTGNNGPAAVDDTEVTPQNTPVIVDVLNGGTPDSDSDGDTLYLISVGTDLVNGRSVNGGTAIINNNGTSDDPTDDFVDYTPPSNFIGDDSFMYAITDSSGGMSFATVIVSIQALLPVTWLDFKAKSHYCDIQLNWSTAEEINNDFIEVQRSTDAIDWETIDQIKGNGTTDATSYYQYVDTDPQKINYYRLKQVDYNGESDYSKVLKVSPPCYKNLQAKHKGIVKIYPNPASDQQVTLTLNATEAKMEAVMLTDLMGNPIYRLNMPLSEGLNLLRLDIGHLPSGQYVIHAAQTTTSLTIARD